MMRRISMLKPEEAARKALAKVAEFKKGEARKALEAKGKPAQNPVIGAPGAKPAPANKEELNALLIEAAKEGKKDEVERLLKAGADVNAKNASGTTALMWAAVHGHTEVAELLIRNKADVNAKDNDGWTALMWAARYGLREVAGLLVENGADVDAKNEFGSTALMIASANNRKEIVELLRANGATE